MATGDDIYVPKVRPDVQGNISAQDLNDIFRQLFIRLYALEGRTEESTIRSNLTILGSVANTGMAVPSLSGDGDGKIYFDAALGRYRVSQDGGPFTDLTSTAKAVLGTTNEVTVIDGATTVTISLPDDVALGLGAPATSATSGFPYVPSMAGIPTGTPTTITGFRPLVYDTTDDTLFGNAVGVWLGIYDKTILSVSLFADENDYDPGYGYHWRATPALARRSITGIVPKAGGQEIIITNVSGTQDLVLEHQDALSAAENRMICPGGVGLTLLPSEAAFLWYDSVTLRWRVFFL